MSVGTGRQNIIILFWKFWEYINGNQTFTLDSHWPFLCSVTRQATSRRFLCSLNFKNTISEALLYLAMASAVRSCRFRSTVVRVMSMVPLCAMAAEKRPAESGDR